jgi:hypothetical protein
MHHMSVSRRKFLQAGSLSALFAGLHLKFAGFVYAWPGDTTKAGTRARTARAGNADPLLVFTAATFADQLNTAFQFQHSASGTVTTKLIEVTDPRPASSVGSAEKDGPQCYSLLFRGSRSQLLAQNNYTIRHDALGTFNLLTTPVVSKDQKAFYYEAIISHRRA